MIGMTWSRRLLNLEVGGKESEQLGLDLARQYTNSILDVLHDPTHHSHQFEFY